MTEHLPPSPCWLLWDKGFSQNVTFAQYELAWTSFKSSAKKYDKHPNQLDRIHPTQKPVDLYKWILKTYTTPDMKILDTHGGSMSIALALHDFGIQEAVICEIDKDYFEAGVARYNQHKAQLNLFQPA